MGTRRLSACCLLGLSAGLAGPAAAFTIYPGYWIPGVVVENIRQAPRWDTSFEIRVGVGPGFAAAFAAGNEFPAGDYEQAVRAAFAAWETPDLRFVVDFGGSGGDLLLEAVDGSDPAFAGTSFTGLAFVEAGFTSNRLLSNGALEPGWTIGHAEILIAVDRFHNFFELLSNAGAFGPERRVDRFQNLLMHEIGHTIGLGHATEFPGENVDNDLDPLSSPYVDPLNPFAGIRWSPNLERNAIMSNSQSAIAALVSTKLSNDDRLGRNVLYPSLPEPPLALLAAAAAVLACRRRA